MKIKHRIMFLRDRSGKPIGCVAIFVSEKKKVIRYQVSVLNPSDKFNRELARQIALGRLIEKPFEFKTVFPVTQNSVTYDVMIQVSNNQDLPSRARKAAVLWLNGDQFSE